MPRSTRNKIRWQVSKAADNMDDALEHLRRAHLLAGGRSEDIEEATPRLVIMLEMARKALLDFREQL